MSIHAPKADYGRHARRVKGILADPELQDTMVRFAIAVGRAVDRLDPMPAGNHWATYCERAGINLRSSLLRTYVREDRRRYDPEAGAARRYAGPCQAPMVRRAGSCGKQSSGFPEWVTNPVDGTQSRVWTCSRPEHAAWGSARVRANRAELVDRIVPVPFANTGGRLTVHLPEINWLPVYRWASRLEDYDWPPERVIPEGKPTLSLLVTEDPPDAGEAAARARHPAGSALHSPTRPGRHLRPV